MTEEKYYQGSEILEVLKQYEIKSNGKVTTRFVDVEKIRHLLKEIDPNQVKGISKEVLWLNPGKTQKLYLRMI